MNKSDGFTIIEILVAILILGIFLAVLSTTLTGSLRMNQDSQRQLNTASEAQRILEDIRSTWSTMANYNSACVSELTVPDGYTVQFINLSSRAQPITQENQVANPPSAAPTNTLNTSSGATCTASTNALLSTTPVSSPTMRRIIVQTGKTGVNNAQVVGPQDVRLTLDVLRPQP